MNPNYIKIFVTSNDLGQRIDVFLSEKVEKVSRNRIIHLIKEKKVFFDDKLILNQSYILKNKGKLLLIFQNQKNLKSCQRK